MSRPMNDARGTMSPRKRSALFAAVAALVMTLSLAGCATAPDVIEIGADTVVVDVRTPAEYADGHLEGAVNIDVQSGGFDEELAALDPDDDYVVYCRSGSRSSQAAAAMRDAGLTVLDAGSFSAAEQATGLSVVR